MTAGICWDELAASLAVGVVVVAVVAVESSSFDAVDPTFLAAGVMVAGISVAAAAAVDMV